MSYDLQICVKAEGVDYYLPIAYPVYDDPTYNLRDMFVECMDWEYVQGNMYRCSDIIGKVERGIKELETNRAKYEKYNPPNGWGDIDSAFITLVSLKECIYETAEDIPIEHLYMRW